MLLLLAHVAPKATAAPYLKHLAPPPLRSLEQIVAAIEIQDAVSAPAGLPSVSEEETRPDPAPEPVHVIPEAQPIETVAQQQAPVAPPPPILQDPLRERVHLEDFLPFFTPPAPRAQPASSATYRRE